MFNAEAPDEEQLVVIDNNAKVCYHGYSNLNSRLQKSRYFWWNAKMSRILIFFFEFQKLSKLQVYQRVRYQESEAEIDEEVRIFPFLSDLSFNLRYQAGQLKKLSISGWLGFIIHRFSLSGRRAHVIGYRFCSNEHETDLVHSRLHGMGIPPWEGGQSVIFIIPSVKHVIHLPS